MSETLRNMTREDWQAASDAVSDLAFPDPDSHEQAVWNMAIKAASMRLCREGAAYPWAEAK